MFLGVEMKITNKTKDKILVLTFMLCLLALIVMGFVAVFNLFSMDIQAAELTEVQQYNKYFTEEKIKTEMNFLASCKLIEEMTDEEYEETFLKGEQYA